MAWINGVDVHYPPFTPERAPLIGRRVRAGEWWGCESWLVKAHFCAEGLAAETINPPPMIAEAETSLPLGVDPELGPARLGSHSEVATAGLIPVGVDDRWAIDPLFLVYCEAVAEVERWLWLSDFGARKAGVMVSTAGILAGVRNDEMVALIAPLDRRRRS